MGYGSKQNLDSSKTKFLKVEQKNFLIANLKLPMDSNFSKYVKFLGSILDGKLFFVSKSVQLLLQANICHGKSSLSETKLAGTF